MRLLLLHPEARYYGGAERVLEHFLAGLLAAGHQVTVGVAPGSRVASRLPQGCSVLALPDNGRFSLLTLGRTALMVHGAHGRTPFDLVHGWGARDWELTALTGRLLRRPATGTLHDHPAAGFISPARRRLMQLAANHGLRRVACVSEAVREACLQRKYPEEKLEVIHNGLPAPAPLRREWGAAGRLRLGFLGVFSERKGLRGLFAALAAFAGRAKRPWELHVAGEAQDEAGRQLVAGIKREYSNAPWWAQVHWHGWVAAPAQFLGSLDLLIVPSAEFDPLPTVLLEAGQMGTPVMATRVGGVPEIVLPGQTGWLLEPGDWAEAAGQLSWLTEQPAGELARCGTRAFQRVTTEFALAQMAEHYGRFFGAASGSS
jgi:colanic acid/amylovoran biosynthesis glycosyltransferase